MPQMHAVVAFACIAVTRVAEDDGTVEDQFGPGNVERAHEGLLVIQAHPHLVHDVPDAVTAHPDVRIEIPKPAVIEVVLHRLSRAGIHKTKQADHLQLPPDVGEVLPEPLPYVLSKLAEHLDRTIVLDMGERGAVMVEIDVPLVADESI